ncbi:MAG: hypothetical protein KDC99_19290 [Cyclobacteriaceae bacterium]|nr:hypothetical protein [Cyclobacteriaceae bacterium]
MATGLKIPVRVGKSGGAAIETNSQAQTKKNLILALSEGGDDNPFQRLGLSPTLLFKIKDAAFRAQALREVERKFDEFSETISLLPDEPITFKEDQEGIIELNVKYINLETNTVEEFTKKFSR